MQSHTGRLDQDLGWIVWAWRSSVSRGCWYNKGMDMISWFFVILLADVGAAVVITYGKGIDVGRLFKKKRKVYTRKKKLGLVVPIRKVD